jgi:phage N-6-adenine-methyltransferase
MEEDGVMTHDRKDGQTHLKDEARTPPCLFKNLDNRFHFDLDVACTKENCLSRNGYGYTSGDNALIQDWTRFMMDNGEEASSFFCNPPYSNPAPFIVKSYIESLKGATVVMLLPSDTSTKSFHEYCMKASEIIFLHPRVIFNNPDGTPIKGSPKFGSMVVVFKQDYFDGSPVISSMNWKS